MLSTTTVATSAKPAFLLNEAGQSVNITDLRPGQFLQLPRKGLWPKGVHLHGLPNPYNRVVRLADHFDDGAWGVDVLVALNHPFPEAWAEVDSDLLTACTLLTPTSDQLKPRSFNHPPASRLP